ncbi:MAG: hypothetical protein QG566_725 [Patescibacteria group bacterium]|jgi:hypothetical protein|nr:hypothetical protein [Patescibacteria group bacterium]
MIRESLNQTHLNMPIGPETEEERIHRLGKEDHFRRVRSEHGIPEECKLSYGYQTSAYRQVLVDGVALQIWLERRNRERNKDKKIN